MKKEKVCILLSSYNGEAYIREQIDSILDQQDVDVTLFVRDDGSCDNTDAILEEYETQNKIIIIDKGSRENLGPAVSFMKMLYSVEGSFGYYAFSDQDDIWKPEKMKRAIERLQTVKQDQVPLLYCSNQILYKNGETNSLRFQKEPDITLTSTICGNHLSGCTMVMNRKLKELLSEERHRPNETVLRLRMHDVWVLMIALIKGIVVYDNEAFIYYRLHDRNTVGIRKQTPFRMINEFCRKLKDPDVRNGRSRLAREVLNRYKVMGEDYEILRLFADYKNGLKCRIALLKNRTVKKDCPENRALFIFKLLINWP